VAPSGFTLGGCAASNGPLSQLNRRTVSRCSLAVRSQHRYIRHQNGILTRNNRNRYSGPLDRTAGVP